MTDPETDDTGAKTHGDDHSATAAVAPIAPDAAAPTRPSPEPINSAGGPPVHLVLERPAIAGNIGACVRLAAATGAALHVCGPHSLDPTDRDLWRPGLDTWPRARVHFHDTLARCLALLCPGDSAPWIVEVGGALTPWDAALVRGSVLVLGPEKGSVDAAVRAAHPERILTLPQQPGVRSLNLAQVAAVVVFEALRQQR